MNSKFSFLIDVILFKVAWVLCVLATKTPIPQLAPLLGIILVAGRVSLAGRLKPSLPLALSALLIGITGDALLVQFNLLEFPPYPNLAGTPLWMVSLWVCFGIMLRPVFEWFLDHCMRSILGFSLGGVIAYWSGQQLGVLEFTNSWITAIGIAVEWAIAGMIFRFLHLKFPTHSENEHS
jgi:hypothetical protein